MDLAGQDLHDSSIYEESHMLAGAAVSAAAEQARPPIPDYLSRHYWWAYIHPRAVTFFERDWLVNLILLGNYNRLAKTAVDRIRVEAEGSILQIACAYGELTPMLAHKARSARADLCVIDVLPIQLDNLSSKLVDSEPVRLSCMDSCNLRYRDETFDSVLLFFLMHEQPDDVRRRTLMEAYRVLKTGGKLIVMDYSLPSAWNPFRYLLRPLLRKLEPFALDLWVKDAASWLPDPLIACVSDKQRFFGGMYQMFEISKR